MKAFNNRFQSEDDCFAYLAAIKWKGNQYICRKCDNTTFHKGRSPYSRRCNRCKYDESVTAGTIFQRLKFSILTAFQIIHLMATSNKGNTSVELSHQFGITQTTCLKFKWRVQEIMGAIVLPRSSENATLRHITVGRAAIATPPEPIEEPVIFHLKNQFMIRKSS